MRLTEFFLGKTQYSEPLPKEGVRDNNSAAVNRLIQSLLPGQTIQGEVMSKNGNQLELRMDNQLLLRAALERDMNIEVGNLMTFQVKNNGKALTLNPLFTNTATDMTTLKALDMAGLPVNEKSVAMAKEMMNQQMSIDRNHLISTYREINQFSNHNIEDILELHKLNMPVNEENLTQLEAYKNSSYQFEKGLSQILDDLPRAVLQVANEEGLEKAADMVLKLWNQGEAIPEDEGSLGNTQTENLKNAEASEETSLQQKPVLNDNKEATSLPAQMSGIYVEESETTEEMAAASQGKSGEISPEKLQENPEKTVSTTSEESIQKENQTVQPKTGLVNPEENESGGKPENTASTERKQFIPENEIGNFLQNAIRNQDKKALGQVIGNTDLMNLLKERILENNKIPAADVADKEKVQKYYDKLERTLNGMERILEDAGAKDTQAFQGVRNMNQNVDFLNQINQTYQFVQLPLRLTDSSAHGDLYVYTNKRNLASEDGKVSAYLHLDMEHLGPVGVYVALEHGKVDTNFTVANDEILDFLEANMDKLTARLEKRGYSMTFHVNKDEKNAAKDGINPILPEASEGHLLQEYAFDVRA